MCALFIISCDESGTTAFNTKPGPIGCPTDVTRRPDELVFYDPPVPAWPDPAKGLDNRRSPEAVAARHLDAMATGNVEAYLAGWTDADADYLLAHDASKGGTPKQWKESWTQLFGEYDRATLVARAAVDEFVVIGYQMSPREGSAKTVLSRPLVLVETSDGEWRLTNDIANDVRIFSWIGCAP